MAKADDELIGLSGARLIFRKTARDTDGALLEVEVLYPPHSNPPPEHYHPFQEEHFQVVNGKIRTQIDGRLKTYHDGEEFTIPAGVHHWMYNMSHTESQVIWQTRPALRTETFFETMWGLIRDKKANAVGVPNLLQLVVILQAFSNEFRPTKPKYWLQKVIFWVLSPIGQLLGYRAKYDRYSTDS